MAKWFKLCEDKTVTISVDSSGSGSGNGSGDGSGNGSGDADCLTVLEINIDTRKMKPCEPGISEE